MKHSDFYIGLEFMASAGFWWRCTDVGTRTILAIQLDRDDPSWYQGPPYIVPEEVFDEYAIEHCHLSDADAIAAAIHEHETSGHPGFPNEVVSFMSKAWLESDSAPYPHTEVLRFERCRPDGEILHPYAGRKAGEEWLIEVYLPFLNTFDCISERDFIKLSIATPRDVRTRADQG